MKTDRFITTVIPTFRRPQLLKRAIFSVLHQTYPNVRVLVCDNASGDETREIVASIMRSDPRVTYQCHQTNIGSYANFNFGMQMVETPFFSLLSDDDMLAPTFYANALKALDGHPSAMYAVLNSIVIDAEKRVLSGPVGPEGIRFYEAGAGFEDMANIVIPNTWTGMVFRRKIVDLIGGVDLGAGPFADRGFVLHAAARFPFVASPEIGGVLMAHPASTSGTMQALNVEWRGWWDKMIKNIEGDTEIPKYIREKVRKLMTPNLKRVALFEVMKELGEGRPDEAQKSTTGLQECGDFLAAMALKLVIFIYCWNPLLPRALDALRRLRRKRLDRHYAELTELHGSKIEFIRNIDALANIDQTPQTRSQL